MWLIFFSSCVLFESSTIEFPDEIATDSAPKAEISSPIAAGIYYADQPIQFSALISDEEDSPELLQINWTSDREGNLSLSLTPTGSGEMSGATSLRAGEHLLQLSVTDSGGNQTTEQVNISVLEENMAPTCAILEPLADQIFIAGTEIRFIGKATDENTVNSSLQVEWFSSQDGALGSSIPTDDGVVEFSTTSLSAYENTVTMSVHDDFGAECTAQITLSLMNAPVVSILDPLDGTAIAPGIPVLFAAEVSDAEDSNNSLELEWSSSIDGLLGTGRPDSQGTVYFVAENLQLGTHEIFLTAEDSDSLVGVDDITLYVNLPPEIERINISPRSPAPVATVTCEAMVSDEGEESPAIDYYFSNLTTAEEYAPTSISGQSAAIDLSQTNTQLGDTLTCHAEVTDAAGAMTSASTSVTVNAGSPFFTMEAEITPSTGIVTGTELQCAAQAQIYNQSSLIPTYQWLVNGTVAGNGASFLVGSNNTDVGDTIACTANATGSSGLPSTSTAAVIVENSTPVISSVSLSPNPLSLSAPAICTVAATDIDETTLSYSFLFQNQSSGASYGAGTINGSSSTLDLGTTSAQSGETIECIVTVYDGIATETGSAASTINASTR